MRVGFIMILSCLYRKKKRVHNLKKKSSLFQGLFLEEVLKDGDDTAGFGVVAVLCPGVLQQHVPISTGQ